jgi:hypothetical protein
MNAPLRRNLDASIDPNGAEMLIAKKMAIANALSPYLSQEGLTHALQIWEHKYAHQPTFAMQRFISEFLDSNQSGQRSRILQALFLALHNAAPEPATAAAAEPVATANVYSNLSALRVFSDLVERILALVPREQDNRMRLLVLDLLPQLKLDDPAYRDLYAWLSQRYSLPPQFRLSQPDMRRFINLVYVALCNLMGPVRADSLLHEAVVRTEQSSREEFPVRDLL